MRVKLSIICVFVLVTFAAGCQDDGDPTVPGELPGIIHTVLTVGDASAVVVLGTLAYVADGGGGLQIIDIQNPESAFLLKTVANRSRCVTLHQL